MGVKIYNEADLKIVQDLKKAASNEAKETILTLEELNNLAMAQAEALATKYEDDLARAAKTDEVLAMIYEEILGGN